MNTSFVDKNVVSLTDADIKLKTKYSEKWQNDILQKEKLRTYRTFKHSWQKEQYLVLNLRKNERSLLCQFRFGILPLRIETGRYVGENIDQRICQFCNRNVVETEPHFLLECDRYSNIRNNIFGNITEQLNLNNGNPLKTLMHSHIRKVAKCIVQCFLLRRSILYR